MKTPQVIFLVMMGMELMFVACKHGEDRGEYDIGATIFNLAITAGILYWGGFWK
jgi:hypothetical protein